MQMQEVVRDNVTLKRRIEAMEADVLRRTDSDRDKFTVRVRIRLYTYSDVSCQLCTVNLTGRSRSWKRGEGNNASY